MVLSANPDLWTLALDQPQIGPAELAAALQEQAGRGSLDFRTRLLIRDSLEALRQVWGPARLADWLSQSPQRPTLEAIAGESLGPPVFHPSLDELWNQRDPPPSFSFSAN